MSEALQPTFSIEKIYVKDVSLEVPGGAQTFMRQEQPQVEVQITQQSQRVNESLVEVTLVLTVTAKSGDKVLFLVEASQAGVFQIRNFADGDVEPVMMIGCANILFPYAREAVSDAITRAGFQPVMLAPVNFEALYQARLQAQQEQAAGGNAQLQ